MTNLSYCTGCARLLCYGAHYELGGKRHCYHCGIGKSTLLPVAIRGEIAARSVRPYILRALVYSVAGRKGYYLRDHADGRFLRLLAEPNNATINFFRPASRERQRPESLPTRRGPAKQLLANGKPKRRPR